MGFFNQHINLDVDSGFLAAEIELEGDHEFFLRIMEIKRKKKSIDFKIVCNERTDVNGLDKYIAGKTIVLLLTGKGILTKKINKSEDIYSDDIIPNAGKEDFYLQYFPIENYSFASVCRKQKADEILRILKDKRSIVKNIFIGLGVTKKANSFLSEEKIKLPKQTLLFSGTQLVEIKSEINEEANFSVGSQIIPNSFIAIFSAAIADLTDEYFISQIESDETNYFKSELKQKNIFEKAGSLILICFFLILFGNYLAYRHYSQRYELLQEEVAYKQSEIDLLNTLTAELQDKQNLIGGTGLQGGYRLSVLADKIGITIPKTVTLMEMNLQPLEKGKLKEDEKAIFASNEIILRGKIFKSTDINSWIKELKKEKTIRDVVVSQYNQPLNENHADFELLIHLN